jgi:hypothetical protein
MIRHVVMFTWAEGVDDDHIAAVGAGLDGLVAAIAEIRAYAHGSDVGINEGNHDYVVVGDFASRDDYVVYRDHPAHQQFLSSLMAGKVAARAAAQYEI